jgi:hypothetical protein
VGPHPPIMRASATNNMPVITNHEPFFIFFPPYSKYEF